jgi:transcriptional pleiotropic regulator of transition state genes
MAVTVSRKIDDLGRVVLPIEYRRALGLEVHDTLEMSLQDGVITMRRRERQCAFCEVKQRLSPFRGQFVCADCIEELTTQNEQMTIG